jgi:hypothetical protein
MALRLAVIIGLLGLLSPRLDAAMTPAERCAAAKMKAAGRKAFAKLKCQEKALAKHPVADRCLAKAELRFGAAFAKAELNGGCATTGDADKIEAMVDGFMNDLVGSLSPIQGATTTSTHVPTSATAGSSTSTTPTSTSITVSTSTGASTTVTTSSTTTSTTAVVIPCGGISPDCSGSCPPGLVCAAMPGEFCACIGS